MADKIDWNLLKNGYDYIMKMAMLDNDQHSIVDIFGSYPWKLNNLRERGYTNKYHPRAYVCEYRQSMGTFAASVNYAVKGIAGLNDLEGYSKNAEIVKQANNVDLQKKGEHNTVNQYNSYLSDMSYMDPYSYMYCYDDSLCLHYAFPYFDNEVIKVANNYGETSQVQSVLQKALDNIVGNDGLFGSGTAQNFANIGSAWNALIGDKGATFEYNNTNIFMERPKYYQFNAEGDQINIQFTLYNTIYDICGTNVYDGKTVSRHTTAEPWQRNFKFIKNFVLKNLPYRSGIFDYRTPCLYRVMIPGQKYFPISFVSNIAVQGIGTRRILTMPTKVVTAGDKNANQTNENDNNNEEIKVIVPEAWTIQITFKSLIANTANLLYNTYVGNVPEIKIDSKD